MNKELRGVAPRARKGKAPPKHQKFSPSRRIRLFLAEQIFSCFALAVATPNLRQMVRGTKVLVPFL